MGAEPAGRWFMTNDDDAPRRRSKRRKQPSAAEQREASAHRQETALAMLRAGKSKAEVSDALIVEGVDEATATALVDGLAQLRDEAAARSKEVAARPPVTDGTKLVLTAFAIVAVAVGGGVYLGAGGGANRAAETDKPQSVTKPSAPDKTLAWVMAQRFVKKHLKSPGSADFGGISEHQDPESCVTFDGDGVYSITGWVDSQNSFGAKLRTSFNVVLLYKPDSDTWSVVSGPSLAER
jgi:hypothetical protein